MEKIRLILFLPLVWGTPSAMPGCKPVVHNLYCQVLCWLPKTPDLDSILSEKDQCCALLDLAPTSVDKVLGFYAIWCFFFSI